MRYVATCPSCSHRLSRRAYFSSQQGGHVDGTCSQCGVSYRSNRRWDFWWGWALSLLAVPIVLLGCIGVLSLWVAIPLCFLFTGTVGYILFPYFTKLEPIEKCLKEHETNAA